MYERGHAAGGTNPSLEAAMKECPIQRRTIGVPNEEGRQELEKITAARSQTEHETEPYNARTRRWKGKFFWKASAPEVL